MPSRRRVVVLMLAVVGMWGFLFSSWVPSARAWINVGGTSLDAGLAGSFVVWSGFVPCTVDTLHARVSLRLEPSASVTFGFEQPQRGVVGPTSTIVNSHDYGMSVVIAPGYVPGASYGVQFPNEGAQFRIRGNSGHYDVTAGQVWGEGDEDRDCNPYTDPGGAYPTPRPPAPTPTPGPVNPIPAPTDPLATGSPAPTPTEYCAVPNPIPGVNPVVVPCDTADVDPEATPSPTPAPSMCDFDGECSMADAGGTSAGDWSGDVVTGAAEFAYAHSTPMTFEPGMVVMLEASYTIGPGVWFMEAYWRDAAHGTSTAGMPGALPMGTSPVTSGPYTITGSAPSTLHVEVRCDGGPCSVTWAVSVVTWPGPTPTPSPTVAPTVPPWGYPMPTFWTPETPVQPSLPPGPIQPPGTITDPGQPASGWFYPTTGLGAPPGIGDCEPDYPKPGQLPAIDMGTAPFPGATLDVASWLNWVGSLIGLLPRAMINVATSTWNLVVDAVVPGGCLDDIIEDGVADLMGVGPFAVYSEIEAEVSAAIAEGGGGSAGWCVPLWGGGEACLPLGDWAAVVADVRSASGVVLWLLAGIAAANIVTGSFRVGRGSMHIDTDDPVIYLHK